MQASASLFDYAESIRARDAALQQVADNSGDWMAISLIALAELGKYKAGWANTESGFTGEDVRRMIVPLCGQPHSPGAWGALICIAVRRKLIVATGAYRKMTAVKSHGRKTAVYQWGGK